MLAVGVVAAEGVDAVVVITEWEAFRALDFAKLKPAMRTPIVVDLRNALDHVALGKLGFRVTAIGKGA